MRVVRQTMGLFLLALGLVIGVVSSASAQLYQVEVIAFEHKQNHRVKKDNVNEEHFQFNPGLPDYAKSIQLNQMLTDEAGETLYKNYATMPNSDHVLKAVAQKLKKNKAYRLIYHTSWLQEMALNQPSKSIQIVGGQDLSSGQAYVLPTWELEGTLRVRTTRHHTANIDLVFRKPMSELDHRFKQLQNGAFAEGQIYATYRLTHSERIKVNELAYFDHPQFGVLVQITSQESS